MSRGKGGILAVTAMLLLVGAGNVAAQTWDVGETKGAVTATLKKGTLTIKGKGEIKKSYEWKASENLITNVIIKDGITSIPDIAFHSFKKLRSITIPNSVTSIGKSAFSLCEGLTSITHSQRRGFYRRRCV
jgi:hypothetical protein